MSARAVETKILVWITRLNGLVWALLIGVAVLTSLYRAHPGGDHSEPVKMFGIAYLSPSEKAAYSAFIAGFIISNILQLAALLRAYALRKPRPTSQP